MSEVKNCPISITQTAIAELKRLSQKANVNTILRVGVKGGGCAGYTYVLEFENETEGDEHFEVDGMSFVINIQHQLHLQDVTIDFEDGLNNRGFIFSNPNAETTCGCGISFG